MPEVRRNKSAVIARMPVFRRLVILWLVLIVTSCPLLFWYPRWGISLLWGFSVCLVPAMVFAKIAGQVRGAHDVKTSVNRFYSAEAAKFMLTVALFALVFTRDANYSVPVFLCAFIFAQIAQLALTAATFARRSG
ncbi:ATP synthase subunit I [Gilvimarinus algae]|uniref:ATP synthase subunit I n=1 Tax=Gilvimarinus algae TaxID=3058037 RepID=A0ABT8TH88_9GAMM|nr:ATP synthase subunit I [Gilvimarinus sp. SDUM040014]MDO3381657.1 ATP synthase subunit I [Gilvimarinus sp. SDUM040014]